MMRFFLRTLAGGLASLPLSANHAIGALIGWLSWIFPTELRRITRINLELCFPDQSPQWRGRIVRESLIETGKALTEAPWLWRAGAVRLRAMEVPSDSAHLIDDALAEGRGVIFAGPHLGAWEFTGLSLATRGPMTTLYRTPRLAEIDPVMRHGRSSTGASLVPADSAALRHLLRALDARHILGILPDQTPKSGAGVFAPFFGQPSLTMTLLPKLARRRRTPVVAIFSERLPRGKGYRIHALRLDETIYDDDDLVAVAALNRAVEALVRLCPQQYAWSYKRFDHRPEGAPSPYRRQ